MTVLVDAFFHPMRMTYPIQSRPFSRTAPKWWKPAKLSFPRTSWTGRAYFLSAPFIAAEAQHHEESHLIYEPLESTHLDQEFPVEHELDALNPPHTGTPLCRLRLFLCRQRRAISLRHPATSFLGNIIGRLSCLSPTATKTTHLWVLTSFLSLNSKHDFCYVYSDAHSAQTFSCNNSFSIQ